MDLVALVRDIDPLRHQQDHSRPFLRDATRSFTTNSPSILPLFIHPLPCRRFGISDSQTQIQPFWPSRFGASLLHPRESHHPISFPAVIGPSQTVTSQLQPQACLYINRSPSAQLPSLMGSTTVSFSPFSSFSNIISAASIIITASISIFRAESRHCVSHWLV